MQLISEDNRIVPDPEGVQHIPVLEAEVLDALCIQPGSRIIDCTLGGGGHTGKILVHSTPSGRVLGLDADPAAIQRVRERHKDAIDSCCLQIVHANFGRLAEVAQQHDFMQSDGVLLDLGVSTFQFQTPDRGFSLTQEGPLDMRFNPRQELSAEIIVNQWAYQDLANLIYHFGEEHRSYRIAQAIIDNRPLHTTVQLAQVIKNAVGHQHHYKSKRKKTRIHPATRTFQALRIAVNGELQQVEEVLPQCLTVLRKGGRLAVISFHSLEDRIVKRWMQHESREYIADTTHPRGGYAKEKSVKLLTRKPITPTAAELMQNPSSRSAKLRVAEKI